MNTYGIYKFIYVYRYIAIEVYVYIYIYTYGKVLPTGALYIPGGFLSPGMRMGWLMMMMVMMMMIW